MRERCGQSLQQQCAQMRLCAPTWQLTLTRRQAQAWQQVHAGRQAQARRQALAQGNTLTICASATLQQLQSLSTF